MTCKIKYINDKFGNDSNTAEVLTKKHNAIFESIEKSSLFDKKGDKFIYAKDNTPKLLRQLNFINTTKEKNPGVIIGKTNNNEVSINVINSLFLSTGNFAKSVLNDQQLETFQKLQNVGLISKKSMPFTGNSKMYSIPKIKEKIYTSHLFDKGNVIYKKDYAKKARLDSLIRQNGWTWIRTRETSDAIVVELGNFSEVQGKLFDSQSSSTESTEASEMTLNKVRNFLRNIGFTNIQTVIDTLVHNGQKVDGNAYVDMLNGVMQIVEGKESIALPEEAMHILVELISQSDPSLFRSMEKDIVNFDIYRKLVRDPNYINDPNYRVNGQIDYSKLKKEAIAKLLAEYLINETEGKQTNTLATYSWWRNIVNWVRKIFGQYSNPFKQALSKVEENAQSFGLFSDLSKEDSLYFSKTVKTVEERDKEYEDTKETFNKVRELASNNGFSKNGSQYIKDGKVWNYSANDLSEMDDNQIKMVAQEMGISATDRKEIEKKIKQTQGRRVSDLKDQFYKKLFKGRPLDPALTSAFEKMADEGTLLHAMLEDSIESMIDIKTGLIKSNPTPINESLASSQDERSIQNNINRWVKGFLATFPEGTRFLTETIVFDPSENIVGTVDFIAIEPVRNEDGSIDSKVDIFDWKSIFFKTAESIKDYKKEAFNIQLNEYKRILKDAYDIENFGKIRAITINRVYEENNEEKRLKGIQIGDVDPSKIDDIFLRPVISTEESTGNKRKDVLLDKLEGIYKIFVNELKKGKREDSTTLREIQNTIYELRVSNNLANLRVYLVEMKEKSDKLLSAIKKNKSTDIEVINSLLVDISMYQNILEALIDARFLATKEFGTDVKERQSIVNLVNFLETNIEELKESRINLMSILAEQEGIYDLTNPEKVVGAIASVFRSFGNHDVATIRLLYEKAVQAEQLSEIKTDEDLKTLSALRDDFKEYMKVNNLSSKEAIGKLVNFDKGILHSKIDKTFFETRNQITESKNKIKIKQFINDNYNMKAYREWYEAEKKSNIEFWKTLDYDMDEAENKKIRSKKLKQFELQYNVDKYPLTAFNSSNRNLWNRNILEEKWISKEYTAIQNDPTLKKIYEFMSSKNKELLSLGIIQDWQSHNFLPNVRKTTADILSFEDGNWFSKIKDVTALSYKNWSKSMQVSDYELNYSEKRDPITGERTGERFVPYISYLPSDEKSFDIFSIYGLMSKHIAKEKYLQNIDQIAKGLLHIEKAKANLDTNSFGKIVMDGNKPSTNKNLVGQNAHLLEKLVDLVTKGETIRVDADAAISLGFREKWNNSFAGKIAKFNINPETYKPTNISATKFIMMLNNFHQKRILGLNLSSAMSNLFGGAFSSGKLYSRYISENDLRNAWLTMTSGIFKGEESEKIAGLVDYFLPYLNNREDYKSKQLSVNSTAKVLSQEWLMMPMRKTEEWVQLNIMLAHLENTGIINGKLLNLREEAARQTNYSNRFNLPANERNKIEKEFENKLKELKDKYKLSKVVTLKEVNGEKVVEIPGFTRESSEIQKFRTLTKTMSKDALGGVSEYDLAPYKFNIFWRLAMTFKNWIPRMIDVRFGEFHYSQAHHSHEYGRIRMLWRGFSSNYLASMAKLVPIPLSGRFTKNLGQDDMIQRAKKIWEEKKQFAKKIGQFNAETFITQDEFVEMFLKGTESAFAEFRTITLMMLALSLTFMHPDDDDDQETRSFKSLMRRQIDKMQDEVGFFYNPRSAVDILGQGIPIGGFIRDSYNLFSNVSKEMFGAGMEQIGFEETGAEWREKAKPMKYTFKILPVMKEILTYMPIVNDDVSRDWGVRIQNRN